MDPDDRFGTRPPGSYPARMRSQVGGVLAAFIGVVLFLFYPHPPAGAPINIHQMAGLFIGIGLFTLAIGTIARIVFRE